MSAPGDALCVGVRRIVSTAALLLVAACGVQKDDAAARLLPEYRAFGAPQRVTIRGYDQDAMEPFVTKDGRYLLFNNSNHPRVDTNLHFAERIDDLTFAYRGEIDGVNSRDLDGVPSVDRLGNLYFVSTRSYAQTLSTVHRARFERGQAIGVELVAGVSERKPGMVTFDAEISADGDTLFFADGRFAGGHVPESADIAVATRDGARFVRSPQSRELLKHVNTAMLEYAPAISSDLLELFFTRLDRSGARPRAMILRAARDSVAAPFGPPQRVAAITGFVEAPALSGDGRALYFHRIEGVRFVIFRVTR